MDGLLRSIVDRDRPSETAGVGVLRIYRESHRLSVNRVTGHSLRRWWQPHRQILGSPLVTGRMSG
jgi:hypothetical protein